MSDRRSRKRKNKNKAKGNKTQDAKRLTLHLPFGLDLSVPMGSLPITIGNTRRLNANKAVYPMFALDFPIQPAKYTAADWSAGVFSEAMAISSTNNIRNWTAFSKCFDEYIVAGVRYYIRTFGVANPSGLLLAAIDEEDTSAPDGGVLNLPHVEIPVDQNYTTQVQSIEWKAVDVSDRKWVPTDTSYVPATLKLYAQPSLTGTSTTTTSTFVVYGEMRIYFRGYVHTDIPSPLEDDEFSSPSISLIPTPSESIKSPASHAGPDTHGRETTSMYSSDVINGQ